MLEDKKLDEQAQEILNNQAAVHRALLDKTMTNWELATTTGVSQIDVARAINSLKNQNYIATNIKGKEKYFSLTPLGKASAPPPPMPDFKSPECDPRNKDPKAFLAPNRPRISGQKHFEGIPGKFGVDDHGAIILNANTVNGRVYKALHDKPERVNVLPITCKLTQPQVYNACSTMVKMGIIESTTIDGKAAYRITEVPVVLSDGSVHGETKKPAPVKAVKPVEPAPAMDSKNETVSQSNTDVEKEVSNLIQKYGISDVMMSVTVYVDDNLARLKDLQRIMERARI